MQVDLEPRTKSKQIKRKLSFLVERGIEILVPIGIVLLFGLFSYAFAYRVVWKRVEPKNHAAAIGLLTAFGVLAGLSLFEWFLIHAYGPGTIHKTYIKSSDDDPFMCDPQGYAIWCSECQHVKPNRAHHSSKTNSCVPIMDHYCVWIGAIIGQGNRKFFILFSIVMSMTLLYILIVLLIFQHKSWPDTMALSIVLYILTGMYIMFCVAVTFQHIKLLLRGQTTLNSLRYAGKQDFFVNFPCSEGRRVVNITAKGIKVPELFSKGAWKNTTDVMGPWWSWLLPIRPPYYEPLFNEDLIRQFQQESEAELEKLS